MLPKLMNQSSVNTEAVLNLRESEILSEERPNLHSDLARFCFASAVDDPNRKYAWANSICFLFLVIGLIGLKSPELITKQIVPVTDVVPVVFTPPPEEQPQSEPQQQEETNPDQEVPLEAPVIATVVAADPAAVSFAVPVEGPVVFAPAKFAAPPPPKAPPPPPPKPAAPPGPTVFQPGVRDGGTYPPPKYPTLALQRHEEGTVNVYIEVGTDGQPTKVEVRDGSGSPLLDKAAVEIVRSRWRFPPGGVRQYIWPCIFQIK